MNKEDIDIFEKLESKLRVMYEQISLLSSKKPHDAVNKFKLNFINDAITQANNFLGSSYVPFADYEKFNEDDIPSNSDVTFVLSSYLSSLKKFKSDNTKDEFGQIVWTFDVKEIPRKNIKTNRLMKKDSR